MDAVITPNTFIAPPVNSAPARGFRIRPLYVVLIVILFAPVAIALGIASYFFLSWPTQALRASVMEAVPGKWDKKFAINVGGITTSAVRLAADFIPMESDARLALEAVRGGEVGIYKLESPSAKGNCFKALALSDESMERHGYQRLVGVAQRDHLVAVYVPRGFHSTETIRCCVLVFDEQNLVVVSARAKVQPLLDLAREKGKLKGLPFNI